MNNFDYFSHLTSAWYSDCPLEPNWYLYLYLYLYLYWVFGLCICYLYLVRRCVALCWNVNDVTLGFVFVVIFVLPFVFVFVICICICYLCLLVVFVFVFGETVCGPLLECKWCDTCLRFSSNHTLTLSTIKHEMWKTNC